MFKSKLVSKIIEREKASSLRRLSVTSNLIDFCSNDYLGFSLEQWCSTENASSTGSRLISGNSKLHIETERKITKFHNVESALLFNSGYTANLGLLSSVPQKDDTILYDQLCHASIRDGIKLGNARNFSFRHNDTNHLQEKIKQSTGTIYIVVESVYSMDGDFSPLEEIEKICQEHNAKLIIDEAHALGVFGENGHGLAKNINCFARVYTYGKAMGSHGAAIVGSKMLIDYLINFSRPFIYTTALSPHSVKRIEWAYNKLESSTNREKLHKNIALFKENCKHPNLIESDSAIQCIVIGGNANTKQFAENLQLNNFDIRPILHPTVGKGLERIRICLHSFNTEEDIKLLCELINKTA
jgi:8-amino-7-oxononanoate synthase